MSLTPEPPQDREKTRLGFIDVLFAIAVGKVLDLSAQPGVSLAGYAHLALAGATTLLSYVGYRNSKSRYDYELDPLRNVPFYHFLVDVVLVYLYFLLATTSEGRDSEARATVEATLLALVFAAYVVWDLLAWKMRRSPSYPDEVTPEFRRRLSVSVGGLLMAIIILIVVAVTKPATQWSVVTADLFLFVLIIAYRLCKGSATSRPPSRR